MANSRDIYVTDAVKELIHKAKESISADEALKFSQAACNVAHARATMLVKPNEDNTG